MPGEWIDVSRNLATGMAVWPGDPAVAIRQSMDIAAGDSCNLTHIAMSAHTGTHIDAPRHFIANGVSISAWTPAGTCGPCRVIEIDDPVAIRASALAPHSPRAGERILFKTQNSHRTPEGFDENFIYIAEDAAQLLAAARVRVVGIDAPSIGGLTQDLVETHVAILCAGIWVIEELDLSAIAPGDYELCCLPLKLQGADGAPARALLRTL